MPASGVRFSDLTSAPFTNRQAALYGELPDQANQPQRGRVAVPPGGSACLTLGACWYKVYKPSSPLKASRLTH